MDVNANLEVKAYGLPAIAPSEREERNKPEIRPVTEGQGAAGLALDDKVLKERPRRAGQAEAGGSTSAAEIQERVAMAQERLESLGSSLGFEVNEETGRVVIEITDRATGEVIRQIPSEDLVKLEAKLAELVGLLFDQHA
ncbi:MAG: flagellar protein FlaG [Thermodesulfobacteriota bacterium]